MPKKSKSPVVPTPAEVSDIKRLEEEFYEGAENANNLVDLRGFTSHENNVVSMRALESLHRIFMKLMSEGMLTKIGNKK
ncbi:hypothetical protein SARC_15939, partial [Sphaeroforma arctica JP610]